MKIELEKPLWLFLLGLWAVLGAAALRVRLHLGYRPVGSKRAGLFLRAYFPTLTLLGSLILATLALTEPKVHLKQMRYFLPPTWIVLDVSHSMRLRDVSPDRRGLAEALLARWIDSLERAQVPGQVGLIVFAAQAYAVLPLTTDRAALRFMLKNAIAWDLGEGTNIGSALQALLGLAKAGHQAILLSDGANNLPDSPSLRALGELLRQRGIQVYGVLVGQAPPQFFPAGLAVLTSQVYNQALPLRPLLRWEKGWRTYALQAPLILLSFGVGLVGLIGMALGGWFNVLTA
ncbi:MAG: VWA domain-containing protein [Bacteroidia bacterium]